MAPSNRQQVEALSELSDIIVQISDEDLERMELLAQEIRQFDRELGTRLLETHALLLQLNDDIEVALERLEPDIEEDEEDMEEMEEDQDIEPALGEAEEIEEIDDIDEEDTGGKKGKARPKRRQ